MSENCPPETTLQSIIDNSPTSIALFDRDMRYLAVSRRWIADFGLEDGNIIGLSYTDVLPTHPKRWSIAQRCALVGQTLENQEDFCDRGDGTVQWLRWASQPWNNAAGSVAGVIIFSEDITSVKQTEKLLKEALLKQGEAVKAGRLGLWERDLVTGSISFSPEWKKQIGYEDHEIENRFEEWQGRVHPADLESILKNDRQAIAGLNQDNEAEYRFRHRDGSYRWIHAHYSIIRDESGRAVRMIGSHIDITLQKELEQDGYKAAETVRAHQVYLNYALTQSHTGSWNLDLIDHTAIRSLGHDRIFGYNSPLPKWTYEMFLDHVIPEDRAEVDRRFQNAIETQTEWNFECRICHADGGVRWIWAVGGHQFDDTGHPQRMAGIVQDITERKEAERSLQESEERYRNLFEHMAEGYAYCQMIFQDRKAVDWVYLAVNDAFVKLTGLQNVVGKHVSEVIPGIKETDPKLFDVYARVAQTGKPEKCEIYLNALEMWLSVSVYSPKAEHFVAVFDVITDRKMAEEELKASESRYRELVQYANSAIVHLACDGTVLFFNEYAETLFGYSSDEIVGKSVNLILPLEESTGADLSKLIEDIVANPQQYVKNVNENICRDGRRIWMAWTNRPIVDKNKKVKEILSVGIDITERKNAEIEHEQILNETRNAYDRLLADMKAKQWLQELGELFLRDGNLEEVLVKVVDAAIAITNADFGDIQLLNREDSSLKIVAQRGFPHWWVEFWDNFPEGYGIHDTAFQIGDHLIIEDIEKSTLFAGTSALDFQLRAGVRALQSTPLRSRSGRLLGIFSTHYKTPHHLDDSSLQLIDLLGRHAADIIDHFQIEMELNQYAQRLQLATASAKLGIWDWNVTENHLIWDKRMLELYGMDQEKFSGRVNAWEDSLHPDDRQRTVEECKAALKEQKEFDTTFRIVSTDGTLKYVKADGLVLRDSNGTAVRMIGINQDITESKQKEEALRESRAWLEAALTSMPDAVFISDNAGRFVMVNDAFTSFHRFKHKSDCLNKISEYPDILEVFLPNGTLAPLEMWAVPRALRGETVMNAEYGLRRKDTGDTWFGSYNFGPIRDEHDAIVGSVVVGHDITDKKHAEEALLKTQQELKKSHRRYADLYDFAPVAYLTVGRDGMILEANLTAVDMLELTREDLLNKTFSAFIVPDDQELFNIHRERLLETGAKQSSELRLQKNDGQVFHALLETALDTECSDSHWQYRMMVSDISIHKEAELARLRRLKERYRAIVMDQNDLICRFDPQGRITFVNDAYCRYFGVDYKKILGTNFLPDIHEDDLLLVGDHFKNLSPENPEKTIEHRVYLPDKKMCWQQWCGRALYDLNGKVFEYQAVGRDITRLKEVEEQLQDELKLRQLFLDALPCIALLQNYNTRLIIASNKAATAVGAVAGKECYSTWMMRESPCPWCLTPELRSTGKRQNCQFWAHDVYWDAYWVPVDEDHYLHYVFDSTEKQKNKEALQRAHEELEQKVKERTLELQKSHAQLLHSEKLSAVGSLSASIAHEFNNPLQSVMTIIKGI
ncbi:MAG: PAS domain S-box protein, partial [Desulfocapsaceae bacterium]|nr:PAS domain S-box protein [Desulfocapsaceae bacterium]